MKQAFYKLPKIFSQFTNCLISQIDANIYTCWILDSLSPCLMAPVLAVRETSVSRHHGGPIEGPPETPRTSVLYIYKDNPLTLLGRFPDWKNIPDQACSFLKASRHHRDLIVGTPETSWTITAISFRGV